MLSLLHHQIVNEASVTTSAFDALAALYYAADAHKEHAPSPFHESGGRSTQHAISEMATEASDIFQENAFMKRVEVHGHVSGGLYIRFDELRRALGGG